MGTKALEVVKQYLQTEEFLDDEGEVDRIKVKAYVTHMLEKEKSGYRFIYADTEEQVSVRPCRVPAPFSTSLFF